MDMTGEYRIPAPRQRVWEALNDPDVLRQSIPGCEQLDKISETELSARVRAKVGPVSATFNGKVTLGELNPPESYTISGEGSGGVAGFARGGAKVHLTEEGVATVLRYDAKADVGGKLAQIGSRLVQGTAKKMADDFFSRFSRIVGDSHAAAVTGAAVAAAPIIVEPPAAPAPHARAEPSLPPEPAPVELPPMAATPRVPIEPPSPTPMVGPSASVAPPPAAAPLEPARAGAPAPEDVTPALSTEALAGGTPPFVPDEAVARRPAAEPPAFGGPDAAGPEIRAATGAARTGVIAPPATRAEPAWHQKPVSWVVAAVIVLIILFWLL